MKKNVDLQETYQVWIQVEYSVTSQQNTITKFQSLIHLVHQVKH